ncbi:MAG: hypothetical protein E7365_04225 [Clostridiales bacterium]|nr:hypothetical protein [Clostridiales bacterium]
MNLLDNEFITKTKKQRNINLILFFLLLTLFFICYIFSFYTNNLIISLIVGIVGIIALVLFYYGLIFDKSKLLKLHKNINNGIFQEDTYIFKRYDDETEHDGVCLLRVICSFTDENEEFERTLYFLKAVSHPDLTEGQKIKVKTYQNIILYIED